MPVSFTIREVPDDLADRIRRRAQENHRSLQGELLHILEHAVEGREVLTPRQVRERAASYGIGSEENESVEMIREDRDAR